MKLIIFFLALATISGCASNTYTYGPNPRGGSGEFTPPVKQQIIVGEPSKILDSSDWIWPPSFLAKLLLWNKNIDSHQISQKTIDDLALYIEKNNLQNVQVLVNTYKPGVQWSRLFKNKAVAAPWRYTFGILATSVYTIFPGRFFGGDHYNPYTDTISIYSDDTAIALHEGGHAKDFNGRKYKGIHAALYSVVPGAPLYYEAVASSDALSYLHNSCEYKAEKHAYHALHPAYGTYVGGTLYRSNPVALLGAIPGHISGAIGASKVKSPPEDDDYPCIDPQLPYSDE